MITLVLGGTRSGKSVVAEELAGRHGAVTYVATASVSDAGFAARVAVHRARRPRTWATVECVDPDTLADTLATATGCVLLDSLGTWVAAHSDLGSVDAAPVVRALVARGAPTVVVSEEVGLSVHPPTVLGRAFVDALGTVNSAVSAVAAHAYLVVAGRALPLPPPGPPPC